MKISNSIKPKQVVALKTHNCQRCGGIIKIGDRHWIHHPIGVRECLNYCTAKENK